MLLGLNYSKCSFSQSTRSGHEYFLKNWKQLPGKKLFYKKTVLERFVKFLFCKYNFIKIDTPAQVVFCEFCESFKTPFL